MAPRSIRAPKRKGKFFFEDTECTSLFEGLTMLLLDSLVKMTNTGL
jgi:hypothetical protein